MRENIEERPAITFLQPQAIAAPPENEDLDTNLLLIGPIAEQYLRLFTSQREVDKVFGLYGKDGKFYIGDTPIEINNDNITVKDKEYIGIPGLWELIVSNRPDQNIYTEEDHANYVEIMKETDALKHGMVWYGMVNVDLYSASSQKSLMRNNPSSRKRKSSRGYKYK